MTSSTSLISFRLEELAKNLTSGRGKGSFWFMLEPLHDVEDGLRRAAEGPAGGDHGGRRRDGSLRPRGGARRTTSSVAKVYAKAGVKVDDLDEADSSTSGSDIARDTAWKDFRRHDASCAELLKLAEQVA